MWKCKYCQKEIDVSTVSEKANHSRWCQDNPKRNEWESKLALLKRFGELKEFEVFCCLCKKEFTVSEREKLFPQKDLYFCSRSCANSQGGKAKSIKYHQDSVAKYTTVCWRYHEKKCIICNEQKIVSVHHYDHNHRNNDPKNLIPLCPTHHQYVHSKYAFEVIPLIQDYIFKRWNNN